MKILITGALGFIGSHVCHRLQDAHTIVGVDHPAYWKDKKLAEYRSSKLPKVKIKEIDVATMRNQLWNYAKDADAIIHLAAMAGVQASMKEPTAYTEVNIEGMLNVLECARHNPRHPRVIYASSSSVYGTETPPHHEGMACGSPLSYYAATKRCDEVMANSYRHMYNIPATGLRFFTVYGPWGRSEMCIYKFALQMIADKTITLNNNGNHSRDFTYVDDVVEVIVRCLHDSKPPEILNAAGGNQITLMDVVTELERNLGKKAKIKYAALQKGDVVSTRADINLLRDTITYTPATTFCHGIEKFIKWFKQYHNV